MGTLIAVLAMLPVTFFLARAAVRFLRPAEVASRPAVMRLASLYGLAAILAQFAIGLMMRQEEPALLAHQTTTAGFLFVEAVGSLIGAFPYVPLFVALSSLADDGWAPVLKKENSLES
jgi:hypothetical protein